MYTSEPPVKVPVTWTEILNIYIKVYICEQSEWVHASDSKKQDQGSKAPSRDHPNNSFMTRLDYIRVED